MGKGKRGAATTGDTIKVKSNNAHKIVPLRKSRPRISEFLKSIMISFPLEVPILVTSHITI